MARLVLREARPTQFHGVMRHRPPMSGPNIQRFWERLALPIPSLTKDGILPLGIHVCDLYEIEAVFVYNARRRAIWDGLSLFLEKIRLVPEIDVLYVDGGFITDKELPKDVDVIIEFADLSNYYGLARRQPDLIDRDHIRATFLVDLLFRVEPMPPGMKDLREFFQYLRPEDAIRRGLPVGSKKGILRVYLDDERTA